MPQYPSRPVRTTPEYPVQPTTDGPGEGVPVPWTEPAPTPSPPPTPSGPTFSALLHSLRRCWPIALVVASLGAGLAAFAVTQVIPAPYKAEALIRVSPPPNIDALGDRYVDLKTYRENQKAIITSTPILEAALNRRGVSELPQVRQQTDPVSWLRSQLKTDYLVGPTVLRLSMQGDDPKALQLLVNAVAEAYLEQAEQEQRQRLQTIRDSLKRKATEVKNMIRNKTELLNEFRRRNKIPSPEQVKRELESLHRSLETPTRLMIDLELKRKSYETRLKYLQEREKRIRQEPVPEALISEYLKNDPQVAAIQAAIAKEEAAIKEFIDAATDKTYALQLARKHVAAKEALQKQLEAYRRSKAPLVREEILRKLILEREQIRGEIDAIKQQTRVVQEQIADLTRRIEALQNRSVPKEEAMWTTDLKLAQVSLEQLERQIAALDMRPATTNVVIQQAAALPRKRDHSRQMKYAAAGGLGVFVVLLLGVALIEFRFQKVNSSREVETTLGITVLGTLPAISSRKRQQLLAAPDRVPAWQESLFESVDAIRAQLLHLAQRDGLQVLMVTSAVGGEGKTSLAGLLAVSLARGWKKTLLIDADLRNPAVHRLFSVQHCPGFADLLRGDVHADEAIQPTPQGRLWVMPAGEVDSHALQALSQEGVESIFALLKEEYDFVIVDASPVLPVADTLSLAQRVDGVLFSILRDFSRSPSVSAARQRLTNLGVRVLGAVVIGDGQTST